MLVCKQCSSKVRFKKYSVECSDANNKVFFRY